MQSNIITTDVHLLQRNIIRDLKIKTNFILIISFCYRRHESLSFWRSKSFTTRQTYISVCRQRTDTGNIEKASKDFTLLPHLQRPERERPLNEPSKVGHFVMTSENVIPNINGDKSCIVIIIRQKSPIIQFCHSTNDVKKQNT